MRRKKNYQGLVLPSDSCTIIMVTKNVYTTIILFDKSPLGLRVMISAASSETVTTNFIQ